MREGKQGQREKERERERYNRKVTNCFTACEFSWKSQAAAVYQIE